MTTLNRGTHSTRALFANFVLTRVLVPLSAPVVLLYKAADRTFDLKGRAAKRNLKNLLREVDATYGFLFSRYGGRVLLDESHGAPSMDHATVVIEVRRCVFVHLVTAERPTEV
jgi:hypothetical protein